MKEISRRTGFGLGDGGIKPYLAAYRVIIRLCVALNDLETAARYFSRLKEAGFAPTYEIYKIVI